MIRAKFVVTQVTKYESGNYATIMLEPRYSKSIPEDKRFAEATPSGKLELCVTVPSVIEQLQPGKVFYLDMVEAPEGTSTYHE